MAASSSLSSIKDVKQQSVSLADTQKEGHGAIRRADGQKELSTSLFNGEVKTLYDNFRRAVEKYPHNPCWARRTTVGYDWLSFSQAEQQVNRLIRGLVRLAPGTKPGMTLGLYARNCVEWVVAENACNAMGWVSVAIYDTFGPEAVQHIINHSEISLLVGESACIRKLAPLVAGCSGLKYVVQMDPAADDEAFGKTLAQNNVTLLSWAAVMEAGESAEPAVENHPPKPSDLAILMYTSGTTGLPKGVMITHENIVSAASGVVDTLPPLLNTDVFISFLPLAHIFERCAHIIMNAFGCAIGFYGGDIRLLTDDIQALRPTVMAGVPRVFDRLQMGIRAAVAAKGGVAAKIFNNALKNSTKNLERGKKGSSALSGIAFKNVKKRLGGRLRIAISGGAPLGADTHKFVQVCFGCPVLQGYGLTESCAAATIALLNDHESGHVGAPLSCIEIKLVDVPDMNYSSTHNPPTGEIWLRGPCISSGYYKDPEKTAEDFDADGWFHTGDVGRWNPSGSLSIIDRKKNMFKLSQGEYIAAEKIELTLKNSPFISQIFIYGDSLKSYVLAVVVPNEPHVADWARSQKISVKAEDVHSFSTNNDNRRLADAILADLVRVGRAAKLQSFELPRAVILATEFTIDDDLLTPTMKLKRPNLKNRYLEDINNTYAALDALESVPASPGP
ncbi:MAG: AMP-binding protein [archaeon]|nr:AMP-binding protein [archaeon]